ncbi:hypothetical protein CYMTET_19889 [Cymbomonas tetramitiformis]|uniref:Ribosome assembly factor mrt4 n=1 Tax=Cymbomonas tetramitiformis TaxID=36881 RepID=A0AAE0G5S4_9CHLO|nr:hypothetical protein CYMTET_19889 [Cymbomonas tetramitiformis]
MPKSKRNKVVTLAKTEKKGKDRKVSLIDSVREAIDLYPHLYVFRYKNMRNNAFKNMKDAIKDTSKVFLGSNKVMQVAFGRDQESEYRENLHVVSERLSGFTGVLFTQLSREELVEALTPYEEMDFARAGQTATETITKEAGPLVDGKGDPMAHTIEPKLRQHGMPAKLDRGVVELLAPYKVLPALSHRPHASYPLPALCPAFARSCMPLLGLAKEVRGLP